ncbi:unnamed protein product [Linum trigynum]|uniref:Myb/SANT-like DNA-binding domain-containing protein n=1 Tax=Linum trigynum TaxID=586398 RepID=A0AAV2CZY8_9ROSI
MSPPSSPPPLPLPAPSPPPSFPNKKSQPIPWTQQETLHLILSYQDKWYSSKRRHLKSHQWEEVAITVATRCGFDFTSPEAKSGTQCRHKMEKLRSRYRVELHTASSAALGSNWPYFTLMDSMERGGPPAPISARPLSQVARRDHDGLSAAAATGGYGSGGDYYGGQDEEGEGEDYEAYYNRSRSINHIIRKPSIVNRFPGSSNLGFLQDAAATMGAKRKRGEEEEGNEKGFGLVDEIKTFIEKMKGVERKKMEMFKETERWRMEMERKRVEMMLASQRKILDLIAAAAAAASSER